MKNVNLKFLLTTVMVISFAMNLCAQLQSTPVPGTAFYVEQGSLIKEHIIEFPDNSNPSIVLSNWIDKNFEIENNTKIGNDETYDVIIPYSKQNAGYTTNPSTWLVGAESFNCKIRIKSKDNKRKLIFYHIIINGQPVMGQVNIDKYALKKGKLRTNKAILKTIDALDKNINFYIKNIFILEKDW